MRTARSRKHKGFDLEKRLARVEWALERNPESYAGRWAAWRCERDACETERDADLVPPSAAPFGEVRLDLGCGKGTFTVAAAQREPNVLFCGIDTESVCIMHACELACAERVLNAVFLLAEHPQLDRIFAPGELSCIYLNFPTPFPKKKKAPLRLTHADRLALYRTLLAPDGVVRLRTDSQPLLDWSLIQFDLAGYAVSALTDDLRATDRTSPASEYERKTAERGGTVRALDARPLPGAPCAKPPIQQDVPQSLFEYLPDDLDSLTYVPLGMTGAVENMRNHKRRLQEKEKRAHERQARAPEQDKPLE